MAKVPFSKLQASIKNDIVNYTYRNKNGEDIEFEIKTYLPFEKKLQLISNVINQSIDDNGFYNPMRVQLFMSLEIIYTYTNLSFTEKMKEDPFKLYDILINNNLYQNIIEIIKDEYSIICQNIYDTIDNIYKYKNSVMGILDTVKSDYSDLELDITELQNKIQNPENIALLKDIMTKMG